uniref:Uncharacterized protein n=1 Tax=Meloidogyne floridensis TaxID=298350 RepID=A0A915NVS6_9BILA
MLVANHAVVAAVSGGGGGRRRRSLISAINRQQNSKNSTIPRVNSKEKKANHGCSMCPPVPKQLTNSTISGG